MWGGPVGCGGVTRRLSRVLERAQDCVGVISRRRRLPHIDVIGQPVFITFRLWGSLPPSRHFPASDLTSGQAFLTMDRLLDQAQCGPTFLKQAAIAQVILTSLRYGSELSHYDLHSWVIMPNHVHLLITPLVSTSKLLNSLKSATARQSNLLLQRTGQPFWQDESYDHSVRDREQSQRIRDYIENNPVVAGLATTPEQYPWSSKAACDAAAAQGAAPHQLFGRK